MCGIAGSVDSERAFELYKSNLNRGCYSSGLLKVERGTTYTTKIEGVFSTNPSAWHYNINLYHSRGPTVDTYNFEPGNNHPFSFGDWVVAHNGILTNIDVLKTSCPYIIDMENKTDSYIIPRLLKNVQPSQTEIGLLLSVLEQLKGTFGLWLYNKVSRQLYITRSGVTLFANTNNGDFSSTRFSGSTELKEGVLYKLDKDNKLQIVGNYTHSSPYFVL